MSHPNRLCHPFSSHNPKTQLPRHTAQLHSLGPLLSFPPLQVCSHGADAKLLLENWTQNTASLQRTNLHSVRSYRVQGLAYSGIHSQQNYSPTSSDYFAILKTLLLSLPVDLSSALSPVPGWSLKYGVVTHCQSKQHTHFDLSMSGSFLTRSITVVCLRRSSTEILQQGCLLVVITSLLITLSIGRDLKELVSLTAVALWHSCQQFPFPKDVRNVQHRVTLKTLRELPPVFLPTVSTELIRCSCTYSTES